MKDIKKLEANKLIKELDYLKSELQYKSELISEVDNHFIKDVNVFLDNHPNLKKVFDEKMITDETNTTIEYDIPIDNNIISEDSINLINSIIDPKLKNLYRSIVKSTHPDKIKNNNLKEIYIEATKAYESGSFLPIISICDRLSIPYEISDEETELFKSEIEKIKNRVSFLETTFTFKWHLSKDEKEKNFVILEYIRSQIVK